MVGFLAVVISEEDSVQPLQDMYRPNERVSVPLTEEIRLTQTVLIPEALAGEEFLIALFFGAQQQAGSGAMVLSLTQGNHQQMQSSPVLYPSPTLRHRFSFSGFASGPAILELKGVPENSDHAPGLVFSTGEDGGDLRGPNIPEGSFASIDWFRIISGDQKFDTVFQSWPIALCWLLCFAGLFALAWWGMLPQRQGEASVNSH